MVRRDSFGARLYRRLLRLYPSEFRDEYGTEMARFYRERADAEQSGRLWLSLVSDLVRTAPKEWRDMITRDLRHAARLLLRTPVLTASAVVTLALGIGANTAIFSVVHAALLAPLPYAEPDRLVQVSARFVGVGLPRDEGHLSPPELRDVTQLARSFSHVAAYSLATFNLAGDGQPERIEGARVSPALLAMLGVRPAAGRLFTDDDGHTGRDDVVVIGHGLWQRRFGADPGLVGRSLRLNGRLHVVVGVLPSGFSFLDQASVQVYAPLALGAEHYEPPMSRGNHWLRVVARLAPAVSLGGAAAEMDAVARQMIEANRDFPHQRYDFGLVLTPLQERMVRDARAVLWLLMGVVALVLLIACLNIANLLLVRASTRRGEMAIRAALGASRAQLVRQVIAESLLLAACGGAVGLAIGWWGTRLLARLADGVPRISDATLDVQVLGFTAAVTLATGILFGVVPALRASGTVDFERLRHGTRRATSGRSTHRLRRGLVVAQVALSIVTLVCAGLLTRSFLTLMDVDPGFRPDGVLTMRLSLVGPAYEAPARRHALFDDVLGRVRALPGVRAAGAVSTLPLTGTDSGTVTLEARGEPPTPDVDLISITPGYVESMGIRLLRGRQFDTRDLAQSAPVAIVDEHLAEMFWPGEDAIGKRLKRGFADSTHPWVTVVGVVGHVRQQTLEQSSRPQVYWPYSQQTSTSATLVVRADGDTAALIDLVRGQVFSADPDQPVYDVRTMEATVGAALARRQLALLLVGMLSVLALVLASIGLYGVLAYAVSQRTHEFGIRTALGADANRILRDVVVQGLAVAAAGCAVGLVAALPVGRAVRSLLYGVEPADPVTLGAAVLLLLAVGLVASYVPARRAAGVDPAIALRHE